AVGSIEQAITEISDVAGSIAVAVAEQGDATAEIAHNVAQTAKAANVITDRITEVSGEVDKTGEHAAAVLEDATGLSLAVGDLQRTVVGHALTSRETVPPPVDGGLSQMRIRSPCPLTLADHPGRSPWPITLAGHYCRR